jgi:hypothetical protein
MDPTITIQNMTGEALGLPLPHDAVCVRLGRCLCDRETKAPASLTLPPHGRLDDLPPEVLEAPALRQLRKTNRIMVRISTPARPARPAAPAPTTAQVEIRRSAANRKGNH